MSKIVVPKNQLRKVFVEILNGGSPADGEVFGPLYLKHMNYHTSQEIDERRDYFFDKAKNKGLPTTEEKEKDLLKDDLWDEKKDERIKYLEDYLTGLNLSKSKYILKRDIDASNEEIRLATKEVLEIESEKAELVGFTADLYAAKKVNEHYIFTTSYKDKGFSELAFSPEDFDELSDQEVLVMTRIHNRVTEKFGENTLKRIALSPFFMNHFYLCEDNPITFYGKSIVELSFNQCDVFAYGKYFKYVLSEMKNKPAEELMDDPDKLIDLFNVGKNTEKVLQKVADKDGAATTLVGATQEDLENAGLATPQKKNENVIDLTKEASKKGGKLNMEELIKLHGV